MTTSPTIDVRRSSDRPHTKIGWLDSKHSFSFGRHYDPTNTGHGLLLVNNDDIVRGGSGFDTHPHRDMEIVTWVLSGELEHKDSERNRGVLYPGLAQRMSAGTGIWHSEMNNSGSDDVHFVQMWVPPDTESIDPGYEQLDINAELDKGGLVPIASGKGHDAAISIRQRGAVLWGGRLGAGETVVGARRSSRPRVRAARIGGARIGGPPVVRRRCPVDQRWLSDADRRSERRRGVDLGHGVTS
jgi:quercetin 2,3-dioxygenase